MKANNIIDFKLFLRKDIKDKNSCLIWPGRLNTDGYGVYDIFGVTMLAHRLLWYPLIGPDDCILHTCDIRNCVNKKHTYIGNRDINNKDRMNKGRSATGEKSGRSKLNLNQVKTIRKLYKTGNYTTRELGNRFGVSNHQISMIANKKSWRNQCDV